MKQAEQPSAQRLSYGVGGVLVLHEEAPLPPLDWRAWFCRAGLAILPLLLALGFYYRPVLRGGLAVLPVDYDAAFYVYQLSRSAELGGQWWKLGADELLGHPYQSLAAKNPTLYEGVELMLISAVTGQFLSPAENYHLLILLILLVNGWVAAWLVQRFTGSYFWAAVAVVLITVNTSTALRLNGHLHLYRYGWVLLAVWCFVRYLDAPSVRRGLLLGLAGALVLQGSFHLGFLLAVVLGAWWLGCLAAGRLDRRHVAATCVASVTAAALGAALTFPVWAFSKDVALAERYFQRNPRDVWLYGADLWQYFVSPRSQYGLDLAKGRQMPPHEGWHYAGLTVLLAIGAYAVLRWRGRTICTADPRIVDRLMGLIGLCVLLSLSGGPSAFLSSLIGSIRCYGRAGLVAVALWSVATPIILHGLVSLVRRGWLRGVLGAAALGLALFDASVIVRSPLGMMFHEVKPLPAWAEWASRQPADTRLAVFPDYSTDQDHALRPWNVLYHRVLHRHAVLNAAEPELLNLDLGLLGASMHQLNPDALRYMLALGYNTLVFRQDFLAANPWIAALPWLERKESVADWHIYRANAQLPALATRTLRGLLAGQTGLTHAARVPAGCWITERFEVDQPVVVTDSTRVRVAWADADRQLVSRPVPALLQHVHTTGFPTYSVCTPNQPGQYSLVFLDEQQRWLAAKPYEVTDDLRTGEQALGEHAPAVSSLLLETSDLRTRPVRVTLTNTTPHYWQAHVYRGRELGSGRTLPYWSDPSRGSLALLVRVTDLKGAAPMRERFMFLPCDLPPHARRELEIPECFLPPLDQPARIEVRTHYQALPVNETAGAAVIRLERAGALTRFR